VVRLELTTDRSTYHVGDVARILVTTPVRAARALLTVEREGLLESRLVELRGGAQTFDVEIRPEHLPNVYVGIAAVEPALDAAAAPSLPEPARLPRYVCGYAALAVDVSDRRLAVDVGVERESYEPGERARIDVRVRDARGAPARGRVAVAVVDEAVLALLGTPVPDPFGFFYAERALGVATNDTRLRLSAGSRLEAEMMKAGAAGDGAAKLGARALFTTTAYWNPGVDTDADGRAHIEFTLPDNLTRFRVVALAASGIDRFGAGQGSVRVAKALVVELALPRFAQAGDTLELACVVTNRLRERRRADVQIATGLEVMGRTRTRVDLAPGQSRRVAFRARAVQAGTPEVRFEASAGDASDAVVRTLPVGDARFERTAATALHAPSSSAGGSVIASEPIAIPARAVAPPELEVTLGASALAGARPAFAAVEDYPYGCLEQRASRLLVLLLQQELFGTSPGAPDSTAVRARIDATVTEIQTMSVSWGALSFWDGGVEAPAWMQAYAVLALARARAAGVTVSEQWLEQAAFRIVQSLRSGPTGAGWQSAPRHPGRQPNRTEPDSAALAHRFWVESAHGLGLYAVSQLVPKPGGTTPVQPADIDLLVDHVDRLPEEERIFLALALHTWSRRPDLVQEIWRDVERRSEVTAATASVPPPSDDARAAPFRTSARATSLALWLGARGAAREPLPPKLAAGLLAMRAGGHWATTQDDALALLALDAYRDAVEGKGGEVRMRAALRESGAPIVDLAAAAGGLERQSGGLDLVPAVAPAGQATLDFSGTGALHAATLLRWREEMRGQVPTEAGYAIVRRLERQGDDGGLRVGDLVVVTLELVVPRESHYLVLVDPLPAALEIVQPHFQTEAQNATHTAEAIHDDLESLPVSHTERRDRELRVFADHVPPGVYAHRYVARVRAAGGFLHPPAHVAAMYTPELQAQTGAARLRVRAPEPSRGQAGQR
jgi:uncharacterized protein YfaS (alpha-2-macroglobulin family)